MDWPIFGAFIGTLLFVGIVLWLRPGLPHWSYYGRMPWRVLPVPPRRRRGGAGRPIDRAWGADNWREEDRLGP